MAISALSGQTGTVSGARRLPPTASHLLRGRLCPHGLHLRPQLPQALCAAVRERRCHRRRALAVSASKIAVTEPWWTRNNPENMADIHSVQEFVDELAQAGDRLVIVDFYAKWCNACRALFPKLCQLCNENPDILLLKVDFDENRDIVKPLSIRVLPFFHLYRGSQGKVSELSASVSKIQRLRDALALHNGPRCPLGTEAPRGADMHDVFPDVEPHLRPEQANNVVARPASASRGPAEAVTA